MIWTALLAADEGDQARARQLMAYGGVVPSEHTSDGKGRRGRITKTGNAHLRRVIGEAAWQYRTPPRIGFPLKRRQAGLSAEILAISWKAQHRLHQRYRKLCGRGKDKRKVVVAIGRELLGFIWAVGQQVELEQRQQRRAA